MMTTLLFECKKILHQKSVLVLFAVICSLNFLFPFLSVSSVVKDENYNSEYFHVTDNIIYDAKTNYKYIENKTDAIALYQKDLVNLYSKLTKHDVSAQVKGYDILLSSAVPYISAFIFALYISFVSSNVEVTDNLILLTFREKHYRIAKDKLLITAVFSILINIITLFFAALGTCISHGFSGGGEYIACIPRYVLCPYDITVFEGLIIRFWQSCFIAFFFSILIHIVTFLTKRFVLTSLFSIFITAIDIIVTNISKDVLSVFYNFNLISALTDSVLLRYSGVKCGVFLSRINFFFIIISILILAFIALFHILVKNYSSVRTIKMKKKSTFEKAEKKSGIWRYELKKFFSKRAITVLIVMLIIECCFLLQLTDMPYRAFDIAYKNYVNLMSEMSYNEQLEYSVEIQNQAFEDIDAGNLAKEQIKNDEIEYEEYVRLLEKAGAAELVLDVFEKIDEQLAFIAESQKNGIDATIIYSTGWELLYERGPDFILILTLIMLLSSYSSEELDCNYHNILTASFFERKRLYGQFRMRKFIIMLFAAVFFVLLFMSVELLFIHLRVGLPSIDKYAVGANIFTSSLSMKLWQLVLYRFIISVIGAAVMILIILILTEFKLKSMSSILLIAAFGTITYILSESVDVLRWINLTVFFDYRTLGSIFV